MWDFIGSFCGEMTVGADNPGLIDRRPGGVAFNIAKRFCELGQKPIILSAIGHSSEGTELIESCKNLGINMDYVYRDPHLGVDKYLAIEDKNGLVAALAETLSLEKAGNETYSELEVGTLGSAEHPFEGTLIIDGNIPTQEIIKISKSTIFNACKIIIAPASPAKVDRIKYFTNHPNTILYCNLKEARKLGRSDFKNTEQAANWLIAYGFKRVIITDEKNIITDKMLGIEPIQQSPLKVNPIGFTGAGDVFLATHVFEELEGSSREQAMKKAILATAEYITSGSI